MQITIDKEGSGELYLQIMKAICGDVSNKSMVDIGCHLAPFTPLIGFKERTYVDIQNRPLDYKEEQQYFVQADVIEFLERGNYYDFIIGSDFLEHNTVEQGEKILSLMEKYSDSQVIFVPMGNYMVEEKSSHPDTHKSGWHPNYFDGWIIVTLPNFHPLLQIGAFFAFKCGNIKQEFKRIKKELGA